MWIVLLLRIIFFAKKLLPCRRQGNSFSTHPSWRQAAAMTDESSYGFACDRHGQKMNRELNMPSGNNHFNNEVYEMDRKPPFPVTKEDANTSNTLSEVKIKQEENIDIGPTSLQLPDVYYAKTPIKTELTDASSAHGDTPVELLITSYENDNILKNMHNEQQIEDSNICSVDPQPEIKSEESKTPPRNIVYYECAECGHQAVCRRSLAIHLRIHNSEKLYKCSLCSVKYTSSSGLTRHMGIHCAVKPYECSVCSVKFNQRKTLNVHARIHTDERPYECAVCSAMFRNGPHLRDHVRVHTGEKPYECSVCTAKFRRSSHLRDHMRVHTGERPFECSVCLAKFRRSAYLRNHKRVHTGEKPYECSVCSAKFRHDSSLVNHMRVHTGEKSYECSVCSEKFKYKITLRQHMSVHSGEKLYKCSLCSMQFTHDGSLKRHIRRYCSELRAAGPEQSKISLTKYRRQAEGAARQDAQNGDGAHVIQQ